MLMQSLCSTTLTGHKTFATSRKAQGVKTGSLKAQPRGMDFTAQTPAERTTEHQSTLKLQLPTGLHVVASPALSTQQ